jgi:hypothetical protein
VSSSLPTNYDWSQTQAPSGPFGTQSIPGSESVLGNLSGLGALGSKGLGSFFGSIGSGALNLNNLGRLAGTVGNLIGPGFDIEASTKALDKRAKQTTKDIDERIANIYPGLTGMTGCRNDALISITMRFAEHC